ncbi:MAG: hypothetical protein ACWA5W_08605 [Phycisphaerales bacterium]
MGNKPVIRIIRNLARSGGTLIGKCIGCMDSVTLISEIHPANLTVTNPMMQAQKWFGLITTKDIVRWKIRPPTPVQFVMLCETRAQAKHQTLVLRDWSHLDYIGVPYAKPGFGFALGDTLSDVYDIKVATTTRHPIDQFLSLQGLSSVAPVLNFEAYLLGCRHFAQFAHTHGFHRYEDFTKDPDTVLKAICSDLDLPFDEYYRNNWQHYTTITGDTKPGLGRGSVKKTIEHFDRKPINDALLGAFRANDDYQRACELLGYDP